MDHLKFNGMLQSVETSARLLLKCPAGCSNMIDAVAIETLQIMFRAEQELSIKLPNHILAFVRLAATNLKTKTHKKCKNCKLF